MRALSREQYRPRRDIRASYSWFIGGRNFSRSCGWSNLSWRGETRDPFAPRTTSLIVENPRPRDDERAVRYIVHLSVLIIRPEARRFPRKKERGSGRYPSSPSRSLRNEILAADQLHCGLRRYFTIRYQLRVFNVLSRIWSAFVYDFFFSSDRSVNLSGLGGQSVKRSIVSAVNAVIHNSARKMARLEKSKRVYDAPRWEIKRTAAGSGGYSRVNSISPSLDSASFGDTRPCHANAYSSRVDVRAPRPSGIPCVRACYTPLRR